MEYLRKIKKHSSTKEEWMSRYYILWECLCCNIMVELEQKQIDKFLDGYFFYNFKKQD